MNDFNHCNKVTGVHWLKKSVENLQIKIKLKPHEGVISLPRFEDYANESHSLSINLHSLENQTKEYNLKWQQKIFSIWEVQRYSDVNNCLDETESTYHDMIKTLDYEPSKIFTYIHDDYHLPLPFDIKNENNGIQDLNSCFGYLGLEERFGRIFGEDSSSMAHLFRSEENVTADERWMAMHVAFDNSDYNEDSQLLLKQESILLSIFHNLSQNYLIISPDVNSLELNPYTVESVTGVSWGHQYAVEMVLEGGGGGEMEILLRKLHKKWERKQRQLLNFVMPSLGRRHCILTLEILTAANFDMDDLYIEFHAKVPESMQCSDTLHGQTHTSRKLKTEDSEEWHFGHIVELNLESAIDIELQPLQLFIEAISIDWCGRHRTEGYSYLPLFLTPGRRRRQLSCSRPEELDPVEAESRRFFVGGCHLIRDLDVLVKPQTQDANFKYVSTGTITVQWSVISQSQSAVTVTSAVPSISSASAVLIGAEAALRKYKKAKARLTAATKEFAAGDSKASGP